MLSSNQNSNHNGDEDHQKTNTVCHCANLSLTSLIEAKVFPEDSIWLYSLLNYELFLEELSLYLIRSHWLFLQHPHFLIKC